MAIKKIHTFTPKKSDSKKNKEATNSKTKMTKPNHSIKKKLNEFGDEDAIR